MFFWVYVKGCKKVDKEKTENKNSGSDFAQSLLNVIVRVRLPKKISKSNCPGFHCTLKCLFKNNKRYHLLLHEIIASIQRSLEIAKY